MTASGMTEFALRREHILAEIYRIVKDEKYKNIKKKKLETTLDDLCRGCPIEFKEYMEYCRSLQFE